MSTPNGSIQLRVENGSGNGQVFTVRTDQEIVAGRDSSVEFQIMDAQLSRRHFRIDKHGHHWRICDLKSKNGTLVNGEKIDSHQLDDSDCILAGNTIIRVTIKTEP